MKPEELEALEAEKHNLTLISLQAVLKDLCRRDRRPPFVTSAAGDLAKLIESYERD